MAQSYREAQLYNFSLPNELLSNFKSRSLEIPENHPLHPNFNKPSVKSITTAIESNESVAVKQSTLTLPGVFNCNLTNQTFKDLNSLRNHYKTDYYKFNVKLKSQNKKYPISEEEFDLLIDGLSNSISGSDSSSSTDSNSEASSSSSTNKLSRLIKKQNLNPKNSNQKQQQNQNQQQENYFDENGVPSAPRSALLWFEAPDESPGTQYGIYRASLPLSGRGKQSNDTAGDALQELKSLQLPSPSSNKGGEVKDRKWTLLMFGGGHFAGMVVSLVPKFVGKGKGKEKAREIVVLEKKTFHRYTTRRKQGGSQSANDNANGKAKSAGAQIRRHNETALTDEVRELLGSWKDEIDGSELIFLRASKTSYKTFFGYEGAVLDKKDPRIRGFSFPTRRPTISELLRAFNELTSIKTSHLSSEALAALDAAYLTSITPFPPPIITAPKIKIPQIAIIKLSKEEELIRDKWERLIDMIKKGKLDALIPFLEKYENELGLSTSNPEVIVEREENNEFWGSLPSWMEEAKFTPTLLHVASAADQADLVRWLLIEKRANPTLEASYPPLPLPNSTTLPPTTTNGESKQLLITSTDSNTPSTSATASTRPILTPYELAPSRTTRNVFRLLTTTHPTMWDWTSSGEKGARVPSGLNEEKEEERDKKIKERSKKLKEKLKEREGKREEILLAERLEAERLEKIEEDKRELERKELERTRGNRLEKLGPKRLGGGPPKALLDRQMNSAGLSEEQQNRIMREQRARAAEARLNKS